MGLNRDQFEATVAANVPVCREHFRLVLRLAHFPATDPGQFVQVACRDLGREYCEAVEYGWNPEHMTPRDVSLIAGGGSPGSPREGEQTGASAPGYEGALHSHGAELASRLALLRRPFSLAGRRDLADAVELDLIHRVVGVATDWLSHLKTGDSVFVLGPLGNRFELPPADGMALMVGGGVGIPPMIYLASRLQGRTAVAFSGALNRGLLPLSIADGPAPSSDDAEPLMNIGPFSRFGVPAVIATDDGSYGFRGFVTQALEAYLTTKLKQRAIVYTCGPEPMMKRVAEIAAKFGLPCQIAVERAMACGMGTCQSCCIRVRKQDPAAPPMAGKDWAYRLACTDGPVFAATDLLW